MGASRRMMNTMITAERRSALFILFWFALFCLVLMPAKVSTACTDLPVRISGATPICYATLQDAYNAAADGAVIQSKKTTLYQDLNADQNISITLQGGYNEDYSSVVGFTYVKGTIRSTAGTMTVGALHTTAAPVVIISSPAAGITNNTSLLLNYTISDGTARVYLNNSLISASPGSYLGPLTPDGAYTVRVDATDAAGDTGSASVSLIVDTTAPIVSSFLINNGAAYTNTATVTLNTAIADANGVGQMQFSNDNQNWSNIETYATSKSWVLDTTGGDGTKTVYAKFNDKAGNFSAVSAASIASIIFDTVAPTVSIISPEADATSDVTPLLEYIISDGNVVVNVDGQTVSKVSGDSLDKLLDGAHTIKVEATDSAGNKGEDSKNITIKGILTIDPVQTPTSTSSQTITGTRESGSSISVSLNTSAVAGTVVYPSSNTWNCSITGLTAGTNTITVTGNQKTISTSIVYDLQAIMTNVEISRNNIDTANGESSTVFLTLASAATVTFNVIPETAGSGGTPIYQKTETWSTGAHAFEWYGKYTNGAIVNDEAYIVVVEASNGTHATTYNPPVPTGSGYISCPDPGSDYDPYRNVPLEINYYVSQPARVKLGMQTSSQHSFPLLNNVPLYTGSYSYEWDGRDDNDTMIAFGATVTCSATPLAENVIITTGNTPKISQLTVDPYAISLSYGEFSKITFDVESSSNSFLTVMLKPPTGSEIALLDRWLPAGNNTVELNWPDYEAIPAPGNLFPVYLQGVYTLTIQTIAAGKSDVKKGMLQVAY